MFEMSPLLPSQRVENCANKHAYENCDRNIRKEKLEISTLVLRLHFIHRTAVCKPPTASDPKRSSA